MIDCYKFEKITVLLAALITDTVEDAYVFCVFVSFLTGLFKNLFTEFGEMVWEILTGAN